MDFLLNLIIQSSLQVWLTFQNNWPFLLGSVVIAALLKLFIDAGQISTFLNRNRGAGVAAATTAAVATPLCSCGTTAVILGMMASTLPWAPIVAFMVASPLTSPQELVYSAGLFGWPFAWAFFLASIFLGFTGGWAAAFAESRGWLKNQSRFSAAVSPACACPEPALNPSSTGSVYNLDVSNLLLTEPIVSTGSGATGAICCSMLPNSSSIIPTISDRPGPQTGPQKPKVTWLDFLSEVAQTGKRLLLMFAGFAFVGYFLNGLMPPSWVPTLFGSGNVYSVLLAATLGLPFYINTEASLPLVRALMDAGMSQGAALAFLISGAGTSIGAIFGALTIARWRVIGLVIGVLWVGALVCGYAYDLILQLGLL